MTIHVCTGWSPTGRFEYGERFLETFDRHWPESVGLQVYVEEPMPMPRGAYRSLWDCEGVRDFLERTAGDRKHDGKRPESVPPTAPRQSFWRQAEWEDDYSFRFDARKFCKQLFIPEEAARDLSDGEILVWLDGDVVATANVPEDFVPQLLGDADGAYLGRTGTHSEIGFWCVRLSRGTRQFLYALANTYRTGRIFSLAQTHSAFVWDDVRQAMPFLNFRNLTPTGHGHVWEQSPLSPFLRHDKGKRKFKGNR